jgi:phosphonate transport system substrate-binding protein
MTYELPRAAFFVILVSLATTGQVAAAASASPAAKPELSSREQTIVLGRVSRNPKKNFPKIEKLARYLARRLDPLGITAWDVLVARDNREMIGYFSEGKVDLVSESVFSALLFSQETGAEIFLREWKKGAPWYHAVFITRKDSPIATLADLRGRKVAFEDPGSTTGFLLPLAILNRTGLEMVELTSPRDGVPADKVGYAFAIEEGNIATWVARGLADAGAFSNHDWKSLSHTLAPLKENLQIFHRSKPFIRHVILARRGLRPDVKARVKDILRGMHEEPEAADVLKAYYKVKKFDEIEGEAAESLAEARRSFKLIQKELE